MDMNMGAGPNRQAHHAAAPTEPGTQAQHEPPRVKKRTTSQTAPIEAVQAFHFVDNSTSSSKEKRAHVMRHHLKEKEKKEKLNKQRENHSNKRGRPARYLPWTRRADQGTLKQNRPIASTWEDDAASAQQGQLSRRPAPSASESPRTRLSTSKADPFDSLPLTLQDDGDELITCWTTRLAYWSGENTHMKDCVFRRAMQNALTFQVVILTYCARYRDHCKGLKGSDESTHYIVQARRALNDYIKTASDPEDDNVVMAVTALSLQEERFGSNQIAVQHVENARQMMRPRLGQNNVVETFLHYVHYLTGPPNRSIDCNLIYPLIGFLHHAERLLAEHSNAAFLAEVPERYQLFQVGMPLHQLLSSGPHPTRVSPENHIWVLKNRVIPEASRTGALLYITMALYEFQGSADKCRRFLNHITSVIRERGLDRFPAVESFLWSLIEERWQVSDYDLRNPSRPTDVGDALKNLKLLGPELQFYYTEVLLDFLMLTTPISNLNMFEKSLERDIPECRTVIDAVP